MRRESEEKNQPVQLSLVIHEAVKLLKATLPSSIEIRVDIDSDGYVLSDTTKMHQLVMKLCTKIESVIECVHCAIFFSLIMFGKMFVVTVALLKNSQETLWISVDRIFLKKYYSSNDALTNQKLDEM